MRTSKLKLLGACLTLLLLVLAGCGEAPFRGSEFEVTINGATETYRTKDPVVPCQQSNSAIHDNYGVAVGDFLGDRYFRFRIKDTAPGTYESYKAEECCDEFEEFRFSATVDEGASVNDYDTDRIICEGSAELVIEGEEYGLLYGTASGTICDDDPTNFEMDFAFATAESGECT